jgi:hypothetical protein
MKSTIKKALEKRKTEIAAGIVRAPEPLIRKPTSRLLPNDRTSRRIRGPGRRLFLSLNQSSAG